MGACVRANTAGAVHMTDTNDNDVLSEGGKVWLFIKDIV
jgi:hypothetical protein